MLPGFTHPNTKHKVKKPDPEGQALRKPQKYTSEMHLFTAAGSPLPSHENSHAKHARTEQEKR